MPVLETANEWTDLLKRYGGTDEFEIRNAMLVADRISIFNLRHEPKKPVLVEAYFLLRDEKGKREFQEKNKDYWHDSHEGGDWLNRKTKIQGQNMSNVRFLTEQHKTLLSHEETERAAVVAGKLREFGIDVDEIIAGSDGIQWEE
jgi:hypothetical protein